jgi:hypothetical protein
MSNLALLIRNRLDRMGVILSALCMVHCVSGVVLVAMLGVGAACCWTRAFTNMVWPPPS